MRRHLLKVSFSWFLSLAVAITGIFSFVLPVQALELETQQYFIKHVKKDEILAVSPNFRGELSQTSLLPSLTEISENYHIKAAKAIEAEKLNGKLVPGLIVYVEAKSSGNEPESILANKLN
ncbi:MAG: hypothetical protein QNJ72_30505 [Pleurocapsa sp. MO_226.B13]|nr:hypothetical protein [Pleurocapsa sp. MO_226.B13]